MVTKHSQKAFKVFDIRAIIPRIEKSDGHIKAQPERIGLAMAGKRLAKLMEHPDRLDGMDVPTGFTANSFGDPAALGRQAPVRVPDVSDRKFGRLG